MEAAPGGSMSSMARALVLDFARTFALTSALTSALTVAHTFALSPAAAADVVGYRYAAPLVVEQAAPFVRLPLPVGVYAHSRQAGLNDLRLVDARGERVPFALLAPRPEQAEAAETLRPVALYPLPPRRAGEAERLPLEVQVAGDRITVRAHAAARPPASAASATGGGAPPAPTPGWLFDLGERRLLPGNTAAEPATAGPTAAAEPPAKALRLAWSAPAAFTAAYELSVSDDLRQWRPAGGGQVLALEAAGRVLAQRDVPLPGAGAPPARFVRLRWLDAANAPRLSGAEQVRSQPRSVAVDPPATLTVPPLAAPAPASAPGPSGPAGALTYDLGAVLPVGTIDLPLPPPQRVAPVRVQGRAGADEPWRDLASTVFYRLDRERPPPLPLAGRAAALRYIRLVPDERSAPLPAVPLVVQAPLASLVFAAQGEPPYRLLVGSLDAKAGALPITTLVPALDSERQRFGRASLGAMAEDPDVARAERWRQRLAAWRPAFLWAVLLAGVAALAWMVWRLARARPA